MSSSRAKGLIDKLVYMITLHLYVVYCPTANSKKKFRKVPTRPSTSSWGMGTDSASETRRFGTRWWTKPQTQAILRVIHYRYNTMQLKLLHTLLCHEQHNGRWRTAWFSLLFLLSLFTNLINDREERNNEKGGTVCWLYMWFCISRKEKWL